MELNLAALAAFVWFAWVGSITPGPNCAIAVATAANFGGQSVRPHIVGVAIGFSTMLLASTLGAHQLLLQFPEAGVALKWFGIIYLVWMGIQLARSDQVGDRPVARPPRAFESALFQYANPKAWMLTIATAGAYQNLAEPLWIQQTVIIGTFVVCCTVSLIIWAWIGASLRQWLQQGRRLRVFNGLTGLSMIVTAGWMARY